VRRHANFSFWLAVSVGSASLALAAVTVASAEWVESMTGLEPDAGSGALEWVLVAVLASVGSVALVAARIIRATSLRSRATDRPRSRVV
jgi:hypothetical protein